MDFTQQIMPFTAQPLSYHLVKSLLKEYKRPNDKINKLVKSGILIALKKGLYMAGPVLKTPKPEPFLIANHLWGPSYISLESALSWHGMIPEKVFGVTSVTTRNAKNYSTEAGLFRYSHLPLPYYAFGIKQIEIAEKQFVLVASAEKALMDKIICTAGILFRSPKDVLGYLETDIRIDMVRLNKFDTGMMQSWLQGSPKPASMKLLLKTIRQL